MNENNLIPIESVAENTKAIKIGDKVFPLVVVQQGSSMDFYKCRAVHEAQAGGVCYIISGCPTAEANGTYLPTEYTTPDGIDNTQPVYSNGTYYYYYCENGDGWIIGTDYTSSSSLYIKGSSWFDSSDYTIVDGMTMTESTVAPSSATWDGYKAVLTDGVYSFEKTLTTGLTYSVVTPEVNGIYSADALVEVKNLYDGSDPTMVFYAPLSAEVETAETGQALTVNGTPVYETVSGVPSIKFDGAISISAPDDLVDLRADLSVSCWVRYSADDLNAIWHLGAAAIHDLMLWRNDSGWELGTAAGSGSGGIILSIADTIATNKWIQLTVVRRDGSLELYRDGQLLNSAEWDIEVYSSGKIYIGCGYHNGSIAWNLNNANMASMRIYNRALSAEEIAELANEFTPTA